MITRLEGRLHAAIAVWEAKASAAEQTGNAAAKAAHGGTMRSAYLSGKADAYREAADAVSALLKEAAS